MGGDCERADQSPYRRTRLTPHGERPANEVLRWDAIEWRRPRGGVRRLRADLTAAQDGSETLRTRINLTRPRACSTAGGGTHGSSGGPRRAMRRATDCHRQTGPRRGDNVERTAATPCRRPSAGRRDATTTPMRSRVGHRMPPLVKTSMGQAARWRHAAFTSRPCGRVLRQPALAVETPERENQRAVAQYFPRARDNRRPDLPRPRGPRKSTTDHGVS